MHVCEVVRCISAEKFCPLRTRSGLHIVLRQSLRYVRRPTVEFASAPGADVCGAEPHKIRHCIDMPIAVDFLELATAETDDAFASIATFAVTVTHDVQQPTSEGFGASTCKPKLEVSRADEKG